MISDDDKKLVQITNISTGSPFIAGRGPVQARVITFTVNGKGPFVITVPLSEYSVDNVWNKIGAEVETMRSLGAL